MKYNTIYKVTETKAPTNYVNSNQEYYIMVPRIESGETDYSTYVKACLSDNRIKVQYQGTYVLTVYNHKGEITIEKKFKNPGNHDMNPVTGTYRFGLYEKKMVQEIHFKQYGLNIMKDQPKLIVINLLI